MSYEELDRVSVIERMIEKRPTQFFYDQPTA